MKSIKQLLLISLKKITILTLVFSIGFIHSIEYKIDVKAINSSANPFETEDLIRETLTENAKGKENALNKMSSQAREQLIRNNKLVEQEFSNAKGKRYNILFNDNVEMVKIKEILDGYKYKIIGKSEMRQFSVKITDYDAFISKYSSYIKNSLVDAEYETTVIPNDQYYSSQWALDAMNLDGAWDFETGSNEVYVAIIDSGVDRSNPDLINADIRVGWDVIFDDMVDWDSTGHGSLVTGIIGASTNNGIGIAGVNWNVAIIPFRVVWSNGNIYSSDVASALYAAADLGSEVINLSLGGKTNDPIVSNAIAYAISKGSIVVAAAGNDGTTTYMYPASNTGVISVGSIDYTNTVSTFSQHNDKVDVVAPGELILSTADYFKCGSCYYEVVDGTSFSSPYVAGVAALAKAFYPLLTPSKFESILKYSSRDLGSTGYDPYYGNGLVDAERVLRYLAAPLTPEGFNISSITDKQLSVSWTKTSEYDVTAYQLEYKASTSSTWTVLSATLTPGTTSYTKTGLVNGTSYDFRIKSKDHNGTWSAYSTILNGKPKDNVAPASPTTFKVTGVTNSQVNLSWTASASTDLAGYKLSYRRVNDLNWNEINLGKVTSYQVTGLNTGENYIFQIQAFDTSNNLSVTPLSLYATPISSVGSLTITDTQYNRISFKWDSVQGASRYDIYQGTSATSITTKIGSIIETEFTTASNLTFNTTYYFKVVPISNDETVGNSSVISSKTALKNPVDFSVSTPNATTADLSWSAVEGAAGYEISYSKGTSTTYTILRSVTTLTTNHTSLTLNTLFNYRVRAYRMSGTTKIYSGYSEIKSLMTPPTAPVIKAVSKSIDTITVTWTKVVNATAYTLYMNDIEYITINDGNTVSYDVTGLNLGESYSFKLLAKNGDLISELSTVVNAVPIPNSANNFKVSDVNFNRISLSWDSVEGADHYDIYQGTSSTAVSTKVGSVTETSFNTTTTLNFNTIYYFKIIPITANGLSGVVSNVINAKTALKNPIDLNVISPNSTTTEINWSSVEGAAGYEISYSKGSSTTYTVLRSVTSLSTNHTGLTTNTNYNYKVRAYRMSGTTKVYSGYSDVKSILTPPSTPVIKAVSKSIDTITLTWAKVVSATGYVVYVNGVENTIINDGNTISLDISGLNLGESYSFRLLALNGNLRSDLSTTVSATPVPSYVGNFKVSDVNFNRLSLSWDSVEGADHYDIYQGTSSTTVTTKISSVSETSFTTIAPLNFNTIYYYKVIPVTINGIAGSVSTIINAKTAIKNPVDFNVSSPNATTADLSWSAVEGAAGYELSYSKGTSTTYTVLRSVTTLMTNHTALTTNTVYNYKVRAYRMSGTTKIYSAYCDVKSILTPPSSPVIKAISKSFDTITLTWSKVPNATSYVVYVNGVEHSVINDGNTVSYDVSGLNLGENYSFSLVSKNGELSSIPSSIVKAIPIPSSVSNFKVYDIDFNRISLSWDGVDGADHYDIYQGTSSTTVTTKLGSVTETRFTTITPLNYNTTYYYKVIPITSTGLAGNVSPVVNAKTAIKTPINLSLSTPNSSTVDLNWSLVDGAAGYEVSYSIGSSTTYSILKSATTVNTNHTGLSVNTVYNYRVRAYRMSGTTKIFSGYSEIKSIATPPTAPVIKAISKSINTITVSWSKVANATGYVLYVNGSEYTTIYDGNTVSIDVSGLNLGESYSFSLKTKNGELLSPSSPEVTATPIPSSVSNFKVSAIDYNQVSLSWESVDGADHYDIYQGNSSTTVTTKIGSITETTFSTNALLLFNTTYYFKVIPVTNTGINGSVSTVVSAKTAIKAPNELTISYHSIDSLSISWSVVDSADGYEVSYSKGTSTVFTVLKSATTLSTSHSGLTLNTLYNYRVRAYRLSGTTMVYGPYSEVKSFLTAPTAPILKAEGTDRSSIQITWDSVNNATAYELYQDNVLIQTFDSTTLSYMVTGLDINLSYNFGLITINNDLRSPLTEIKNVRTKLAAPTNLTLESREISTISYSFDSAKDATGYQVYRSTTLNGPYTLQYEGISYPSMKVLSTACDIIINQEYFYKVRSVLKSNIGVLYSDFTPVQSLKSSYRVASFQNGDLIIDFVNLDYTSSSSVIKGNLKITNKSTSSFNIQLIDEVVNNYDFNINMNINVPANSSMTSFMSISKVSLSSIGYTKVNRIHLKLMVHNIESDTYLYSNEIYLIFYD